MPKKLTVKDIRGFKCMLVLQTAHEEPFTVQSDFARAQAEAIAMCASLGLITTMNPQTREFGRVWKITVAGLHQLQQAG